MTTRGLPDAMSWRERAACLSMETTSRRGRLGEMSEYERRTLGRNRRRQQHQGNP
jgi:hypothetical protein